MGINDVMGLSVELEANTTKFMADLRKATKGLNLGFDPKDLIRTFSMAQGKIHKTLADTVASAATSGFSKTNIQKLTKKLTSLSGQMAASEKKRFDLSMSMRRAGDDKVEKDRLKALRKEEEVRLKSLGELFKKERTATDDVMKRRKKHMKDAAESLKKEHMKGMVTAGKAGEAFAEGMASAFNQIKSGNFGGAIKTVGKGAKDQGKSMLENAQKGGKEAGIMGKIGGFLSVVGPAIAAIGAMVAGLAAVASIAFAADSAMKGLNKTLTSTGVGAADLANEYNMLGGTLTNISSHFAGAFALNNLWGTNAKDHLEILGGFAQAGVTFKRMKEEVAGAGDEMDRLQRYTEAALTYSKLLGMSTQEVATAMSSYMEELGYTLEGVKSRFSNITAAAKESGFSTKRFFNMVLQATSGMTMYNVRLEEAAGLLTQLGGILGQKKGGEMLQKLVGGFKDESTIDSYKNTIKTGTSRAAVTYQIDATNFIKEFTRKLRDIKSDNPKMAGAILTLLTDAGLPDPAKDPKGFAKKLSRLKSDRLGRLSFLISSAGKKGGVQEGLARDVITAHRASQAFKGTTAGVAAARSGGGANATLWSKFNAAFATIGKTPGQIDVDDTVANAALENQGIAGVEKEMLRRIDMNLRAQYDAIKMAKKGGPLAWAQFNQNLAESIGVRINEKGKTERIRAGAGGEVTYEPMGQGYLDFFMGMGESLLGGEQNKISEDTLLAQEIAGATTDMASTLERGVQAALEKIYSSVRYIAGIMGLGAFKKEQKQAKEKALLELRVGLAEGNKQLRAQNSVIGDRTRKLRSEKSEEKRAEYKKEIADAEKAKAITSKRMKMQRVQQYQIGRLKPEDVLPYYNDRVKKDDPSQSDVFKAAALQTEGGKRALEKYDPSLKERAVRAAAAYTKKETARIRKANEVLSRAPIKPGETQPELESYSDVSVGAEQAAQAVYAEAPIKLGLAGGTAETDVTWHTANAADPAQVQAEQSLRSLLKGSYVDPKTVGDKGKKEAEAATSDRSGRILKGISTVPGATTGERLLAAGLYTIGVRGGATTLIAKARGYIKSDTIPVGLPGGQSLGEAIQGVVETKPRVPDKKTPSTLKSGGGAPHASNRGGINIQSYGNSQEILRGILSAVAAGVV